MGVLPLQFKDGLNRSELKLDGTETYDIIGIEGDIVPQMELQCKISYADGAVREIPLLCRIDTLDEVEYYRHGGILQYVLRNMMEDAA